MAVRDAPRGGGIRGAAALLLLLIAIVAGLALLDSFFVEPTPGRDGDGRGEPGPEAIGDGGGFGGSCEDVSAGLGLATGIGVALTVALAVLAITRARHLDVSVAKTPWFWVALALGVVTVIVAVIWIVVATSCDGVQPRQVSCAAQQNVAAIASLVAGGIAVVMFFVGAVRSQGTGGRLFDQVWSWIAVGALVVAALGGLAWLFLRLTCDPPDLEPVSCQTLVQTALIAAACLTGVAVVAFVLAVVRSRAAGRAASGSAWFWVAVAAFVLAVVALVFWLLTTLGCDPPGMDARPPTCEGTTDTLGILTALGAAIAIGLLLVAIVRARTANEPARSSAWLWCAVAMAVITALVGIIWAIVAWLCSGGTFGFGGRGMGGGGGGGGGGGSADGQTPVQPPPELPVWGWILVAIAAVALVAVLASMFARRRMANDDREFDATPEVSAKERAALQRLVDAPDLTSVDAVVAAYRSFLAWADEQGLPKAMEDTPLEHAHRVADRFSFPPEDMYGLIDAYQVARMSLRDPDEVEREAALGFNRRYLGGRS